MLSPAGDATSKDQDTEAFAVYVGPDVISKPGHHAESAPAHVREASRWRKRSRRQGMPRE
jgi:hypothetical protein